MSIFSIKIILKNNTSNLISIEYHLKDEKNFLIDGIIKSSLDLLDNKEFCLNYNILGKKPGKFLLPSFVIKYRNIENISRRQEILLI